LFDAVYVPGGAASIATLQENAAAIHFTNEAYKHCKTIAVTGDGIVLLRATYAGATLSADNPDGEPLIAEEGMIIGSDADSVASEFINAIAQHRHWQREKKGDVPA